MADYFATNLNASSSLNPPLRSVGVDDGAFYKRFGGREKARTILVAVFLQDHVFSKVRIGWITVDGLDATDVLLRLLSGKTFDVVFLSGITFGGFNVIDVPRIYRRIRRPTIVVCPVKPDNRAVRRALMKHFSDWRRRWEAISSLGRIYSTRSKGYPTPLYFETFGISPSAARRIISRLGFSSRLPEPIRVARLIARGLTH